MSGSLEGVLAYTAIPSIGILMGSAVAVVRAPGAILAEAHEVSDTPVVTATFFAGFLLPIVIAAN